MRIHYLQHVHFEDPANIFKWAKEKGHSIKGSRLFFNEPFPDIDDFDLLLVMGGPMGIYDEEDFPFLKEEKRFIEKSISRGKKVLGICLGAQLIADVLGGKVYKNRYKEIGWFPVFKTKEAKNSRIFSDFPDKLDVFHWHGDTFEIPQGGKRIFFSEGCENQGFEYNSGKVIALQFHLETTQESAKALIENSIEELKEKGKYIQPPEEILSNGKRFAELENYLFKMMDKIEKI